MTPEILSQILNGFFLAAVVICMVFTPRMARYALRHYTKDTFVGQHMERFKDYEGDLSTRTTSDLYLIRQIALNSEQLCLLTEDTDGVLRCQNVIAASEDEILLRKRRPTRVQLLMMGDE